MNLLRSPQGCFRLQHGLLIAALAAIPGATAQTMPELAPGTTPALPGPALPVLPDPAPVANQEAPVSAAGAVLIPALDRRLARFAFARPDGRPGARPGAPVLGPDLAGTAHRMLKDLAESGRAAGNAGDLYDNRDRGHSRLRRADHPQLAHVTYDAAARAEELDYGLADRVLFDAPALGNSSTALTAGPFWRSLPRLALTGGDGTGPLRLYQNYAAGQIHVYPEHRDHDPARGDLIPANTPYYLISQGSSGSDRPHLEALAMILAAFRPDTKAVLVAQGLIAPTVQMVYRRSQTTVLSRAAYLSGLAHPSVFDARVINLARMVALANAVLPGDAPPMVRLAVTAEDAAVEGVDFFGAELSERFFDTPSAIARIWRGSAWRRSMVVSAEATRDPNGRPLSFTWALLRGDPAHVRIAPLNPEGSVARLTLDWQDPRPVAGLPEIASARIDIGIFASNGVHDSAPAFVSVLLPSHETRRHAPGPDGAIRIESIDRAAPAGTYVDPALFPRADWRDDYAYDAAGALAGWTRTRNGYATDYDATGARILTRDAAGRPLRVERVTYGLAAGADGLPVLRERGTGVFEDRTP